MKKEKKHMDTHLILGTRSSERGMSLIESMIATVVIMVGLTAVLGLFTVGMAHNQAHGNLASRATTFGQAKMEDLLNIPFGNASTNTAVFPPTPTGGNGLCNLLATQSCGSVDPAAALNNGYSDYLDYDGTTVTSTQMCGAQLCWFYRRQWFIQADTTGNLKTITVRTTAKRTAGSAAPPFTVLMSVKSR
jgi:type II secretory pathway pseudopilin PulG